MVTTEANGPTLKFVEDNLTLQEEKSDQPRKVNLEELDIPDPFSLWEPIRQSSFFTTGGLAKPPVVKKDDCLIGSHNENGSGISSSSKFTFLG